MPGRPFLRAFKQKLKENGGWTAIFDRIAEGRTLRSIAPEYGCSESWLCHQLRDNPERRAIYESARKEAARALAEKGLEAVEHMEADRDQIQKVKVQTDYYRWLASKYDREQFGEPADTGITINLDTMFLDALKRVNRTQVRAAIVTAEAGSGEDSEKGKAEDIETQLIAPATK